MEYSNTPVLQTYMDNGQNLSDFSMLELFRTEVETHVATLNEGLLALEQNPTAGDTLESLMRAAHSIKGGARIVELDAAVDLAHIMEDCFVAAQKTQVTLESASIDVLLQGVDVLREISEAAAEGDMEWNLRNQERIEDLTMQITSILDPNSAPAPEAFQRMSSPPAKGQGRGNSPEQRQQERTPPAPTQEAKTSPSPPQGEHSSGGTVLKSPPEEEPTESSPPESAPDDSDRSMLEFFRSEVENHVAVVKNVLTDVQADPTRTDKLDVLIREIHAIEGGAQIVDLERAARIAQNMKDCLIAAQQKKGILGEEQIETLLQGLDLLRTIAKAACEGQTDWQDEQRGAIDNVLNTCARILSKAGSQSPAAARSAPASRPVQQAAAPPDVSRQAAPQVAKSAPQGTGVPQKTNEQKPPPKKTSDKDRTVRVSATKIERLMGLAGEVVVSARWLPPFSESLFALKKTHGELFAILERLRDSVRREEGSEPIRDMVLQARDKTKEESVYLADRLHQIDVFSSTFATLSDRLYHEVVGIRMRPFADGVQGFPRMVRDLARELDKQVHFEIIGKATEVDRDILEKLDAPLTHLLRNAVDHGIEPPQERLAAGKPETGKLTVEAAHRSGMLLITVSDDGRGIDLAKLRQKVLRKGLANADIVNNLTESELMKFLFLPGFSTSEHITEISGRGVGLDVVDNMVHEVGGVVRAATRHGEGVSFFLELPLTLSVIRTFLVEIAEEPYAFPLARIDRCLILQKEQIKIVEDRQYFEFDHENIALIDVHDVLEIDKPGGQQDDELPVVVISDRANSYGLLVDTFVGENDLVVRPLDSRLGKVPDISAAAVMLDGSPILIFDIEDLVRSIDKMLNRRRLHKLSTRTKAEEAVPAKRVLVVDDSITVRETERKLLENTGYHVEVAVDGLEGWNAVRSEQFDLVISDVDMPRMNGIEFVSHIKDHHALKSLPVIIVSYKDTEEHRMQGLEAGANYYLTKSSFQDNSFIDAVVDLIGEA